MYILKKKIFLRSETTSFRYYKNNGFEIFDTGDIDNLSFRAFIHTNEAKLMANRKLIYNEIKTETIIKQWQEVFSI